MSRPAPIETKVQTAVGGTLAGGTLGTFLLWLLGVLVWGADWAAVAAEEAVRAVPTPVAGLVLLGVTALGTYVGGYLGKHTARPDLAAAPDHAG